MGTDIVTETRDEKLVRLKRELDDVTHGTGVHGEHRGLAAWREAIVSLETEIRELESDTQICAS